MKNLLLGLACASLLFMSTGCANGPVRSWLKGAACNTCTPPLGQPPNCGTNLAPGCNGNCPGTQPFESPVMAPNQIPGGGTPYYPDATMNGGFNSEGIAPSYPPVDYGGQTFNQPGVSYGQPVINSGGIPSAEVYGGGIIGDQATPPSIGPN